MTYSKKAYSRTRSALKALIQNSIEGQATCSDYHRDNVLSYIDSWCTVRMTGPRQSGHTTAMVEVGRKMFKEPIFLFHSCAFAKNCKERFELERAFSVNQLNVLRGYSCDALFVDCSFFLSPAIEEEIRRLAVAFSLKHKTFCLVFVQ